MSIALSLLSSVPNSSPLVVVGRGGVVVGDDGAVVGRGTVDVVGGRTVNTVVCYLLGMYTNEHSILLVC